MVKLDEVVLNDNQQSAYDSFVHGHKNIFLTGGGGTGKSVLVGKIVSEMRRRLGDSSVAVTASTGIAGNNIGGSTVHSFSGIGTGESDVAALISVVRKSHYANRWKKIQVLVIDEVSMISAEVFDKLVKVARSVRECNRGFGGIQVLLTGDFLQLPPVEDRGKSKPFGRRSEPPPRAFESEHWEECIDEFHSLVSTFRQGEDPIALHLAKMRCGFMDNESTRYFKGLERYIPGVDGEEPVDLYPMKKDAERRNSERLDSIAEEPVTYVAVDELAREGARKQLDQCQAPRILDLKVGAQVMLVRNLSEGLVNGSTGIVESLTKPMKINIGGSETHMRLPKVKFTDMNGRVKRRVMGPEVWRINSHDGTLAATRMQIPLILAWAITIHKSQGQTIKRLRVHARWIFEVGQLYVALSRASSSDGLQIVDFDSSKAVADPKAVRYHLSKRLR